jgi:hypothetical protein
VAINYNIAPVPASPLCIYCLTDESVDHALLFYPFARAVWNAVKVTFGVQLDRKGFINYHKAMVV